MLGEAGGGRATVIYCLKEEDARREKERSSLSIEDGHFRFGFSLCFLPSVRIEEESLVSQA